MRSLSSVFLILSVWLASSAISLAHAADPGTRAPVALVIDPQGLEWCSDRMCFRLIRVLSVIRNRTGYEIPHELIVTHPRATPALTTAFVFLRIACGTGTPIWDVFPANQPPPEGPLLTTTFGRHPYGAPVLAP